MNVYNICKHCDGPHKGRRGYKILQKSMTSYTMVPVFRTIIFHRKGKGEKVKEISSMLNYLIIKGDNERKNNHMVIIKEIYM